MSRYSWPKKRKNPDRPRERAAWNSLTDGVVTERAVVRARAMRERRPPPPGALARGAPQGTQELWVPVGPSTVLRGQGSGRPRVAGRIRDLAVSPDGNRAYAAAANGGVWFTSDAGESWHPVGNWLPTPDATSTRVAQTALTCGCLHVIFGFGANQDLDEVYIGTGELSPRMSGTPGGKNGGVGVLRLKTPITQAIADPFGEHWEREASNLAGLGIYRLARDPEDPEVIVAVTSGGVFSRTGPFVRDADWDWVDSGPLKFDADDGILACDVLWIPSTPSRLVVALYGKRTGVYVSEDGIAGDFEQLDLPALRKKSRIALSYSDVNTDRMYVLAGGPVLYRVGFSDTDDPTVLPVVNLPKEMFGRKDKDSSYYNIAIATDPDNSSNIIIGGSTVSDGGAWTASLFQSTVVLNGDGDLDFAVADANQDNLSADASYIGSGVHADVHQICLVRVGGALHGWIACDGGVFRSTNALVKGTYQARNLGLAVLEGGYVASHPTNDHFMILGTQDNGVLQRVGDSVWLHTSELTGDGGGVAFHPAAPRYFVGQYTNATWKSGITDSAGTGQFAPPVKRGNDDESEAYENSLASFYSGIDVAPGNPPATVAKVAIGTHRVWVSEDWVPTSLLQNSWVTLPSGIDPRGRNPRDYGTDADSDYLSVVATRWANDGRLFALHERTVLVYTPPTVAGTTKWSVQVLTKTESTCGDYEDSDIELPSSDYLPPLGAWSDLALDDPASAGTACYVACTGHATLDDHTVTESTRMDTLWWYDGNGKWWSTGLRNDDASGSEGIEAPAYAVLVDPDDRNVVYVGTALGVWKGVRSMNGTTPVWLWETFSNGLPEAAVHDLSMFGESFGVKLLRATIRARGVWEVDLSPVPTPVKRVYLRAAPHDTRRQVPADLVHPTTLTVRTWPWYISPDLRIARTTEAAPWGSGTPTEADFLERDEFGSLVNATTDPADGTVAGTVGLVSPLGSYAAAQTVLDAEYRLHVLVHSRDITPVVAANVRTLVLIGPMPDSVQEWEAVAISAPLKDAIVAQLTTTPPPAWPAGLPFVPMDRGVAVRSLGAEIDARTPRTVSFDVDFRGAGNHYYLLMAIVSSSTDPVTRASLDGGTLEDLVLNSHHVGMKVVRKL